MSHPHIFLGLFVQIDIHTFTNILGLCNHDSLPVSKAVAGVDLISRPTLLAKEALGAVLLIDESVVCGSGCILPSDLSLWCLLSFCSFPDSASDGASLELAQGIKA